MSPMPAGVHRNLCRLTLAAVLVVMTSVARGLDAAMAVALSLAVMEIDAHNPVGTDRFHSTPRPPDAPMTR